MSVDTVRAPVSEAKRPGRLRNSFDKYWYAWAMVAPVVIVLAVPVSYTHLRAHETVLDLVCHLLLEKKTKKTRHSSHTYALT